MPAHGRGSALLGFVAALGPLEFTDPALVGKRSELLKTVAPALSRAAVLVNPANPVYDALLRGTPAQTRALGLELQTVEARAPEEFAAAFAALTDPVEWIRPFEVRHQSPDAGALFAWAVDSLHYLGDIDQAYDTSHEPIGGHRPEVVDVAHARWATGTCITALDLCAAGLRRAFCGHSGARELGLADFAPGGKPSTPKAQRRAQRQDQRRTQLPPPARQWVDAVRTDPRYQQIKSARNWLTHARLRRHFTLEAGGPPQRLQLELGTWRLGVRPLVELARDVGTRHVSALLAMLPTL